MQKNKYKYANKKGAVSFWHKDTDPPVLLQCFVTQAKTKERSRVPVEEKQTLQEC